MPRISGVLPRCPRMSAELSLEGRVKPDRIAKWGTGAFGEEGASVLRSASSGNLNSPNRRMRTRMSGGVGGE